MLGGPCRAEATAALFHYATPTLTLRGGILLRKNNDATQHLDASGVRVSHIGVKGEMRMDSILSRAVVLVPRRVC